MRYHIATYGCQRNQSDSERIAAYLEKRGHLPTSDIAKAGLIVVNACSVRQSAIDRIWGKVKEFEKFKIRNKKLKTILTGCVLKKDKQKFSKFFDNVITQPWVSYHVRPKYQSAFRAYVPVMSGCNNFCTYCVVPHTRGRELSRPPEEIICEVKNLVKREYKEIWLLGENVNSYQFNFPQLLRTINNIPGKFWIRFTSPHPKDFSNELIETMSQCPKITEYLNLPVQSGDDKILKKMNRPYTVEYYKNLVKKIRKKIPNICLSTDIIVGFPGETKNQFENTVKLFKEIKYDMAYISKYSQRPGTIAAKMEDSVLTREKKRREKVLTEVLKRTALKNNKKYVGNVIETLPEERKNKFLIGKSQTYKTVKFEGPKSLIGKFVKVKIVGALPWGLTGKLLN